MELHELSQMVELAIDILIADHTIKEAEVCASWCEQERVAIHYDPGVTEEALFTIQTTETQGLSIFVVLEDAAGRKVGFGSDLELSRAGIIEALEVAKSNAAPEPLYRGLPRPVATPPARASLHDQEVLTLPSADLVTLAEEALDGAITQGQEAGHTAGVTIRGDVRSHKEIMLVGNTHGLRAHETTTALHAAVCTQIASFRGRGMGRCSAPHLNDFSPADAGAEAIRQALQGQDAITLPTGEYTVIFGPQAVAELFQDLILPALCLDTVAAGASPFAACFGQTIASPLLTLSDDGTMPGLIGSHLITGDGIPTGHTPLITRGQLVGLLANVYHAQALDARFGPLFPHNGMRFALDLSSFAMRPGIFPTNVVLCSEAALPLAELLAPIEHGIYIGSLWWITPEDGLHTGAFHSIVVGPSWHIQHGALGRPLQAESLRLEANYVQLLQQITGIATTPQAVTFASYKSVMLAPEVRCAAQSFVALAKGSGQ